MAEVNPSLKGKYNSRIPRLQRSASFHGEAKKSSITQEITEEDLTEAQDDIGSLSSVCSVASCAVSSRAYRKAVETACDFQKGNSSKFAFHCSTPSTTSSQGEYLTPTQRANRTIRQLKSLLKESEANSNYKDFEIQRLTRELVGLRLEHAQCEKRISGVDKESENAVHLTAPSLADSGHFDDLSYHTSQFKDSFAEKDVDLLFPGSLTVEKNRLTSSYLEKMDDLIRQHTIEMQEVRSRFTDRLESALTQLSDSNTRYANLLTSHDFIRGELERGEKEKVCLRQHIELLERKVVQLQNEIEERETLEYETREKELIQIESLTRDLTEKNEMILELQSKLEDTSVVTDLLTSSYKGKIDCYETQHLETVASSLEQQDLKNCSSTKCLNEDGKGRMNHVNHSSADPSTILKFLRSAIFYLLTDNENGAEHLRAIQSILEFSPEERFAVERVGRNGYYL